MIEQVEGELSQATDWRFKRISHDCKIGGVATKLNW